MKIHFRFFLSHDNSEKYQYFLKRVCILRKFRAKIAQKRRALRDVLMLLFTYMTSLAKERETAVKSVINVSLLTCVILENLLNGYMKGKIM